MKSSTSQLFLTTVAIAGMITMVACGGETEAKKAPGTMAPAAVEESAPSSMLIQASDITLGDIDNGMAEKGKTTYDVKCQACHSLGTNRVVGPGWKGIVTKRQPEWIMNMIVHTEAMLETDAEAQKMLEECLVRMPNQNLTHDHAREVLEYMRTL